ncbi:MBL fold metallo-hydrolase [Thiohalorhabdus methylotrophus]|uniref:MBL fold metallo-hydrolase n=1 Tax=Thiohalorhabdus methylotrophus TaxID=3242694 RepID=A0ABV4TS59_9GAMM
MQATTLFDGDYQWLVLGRDPDRNAKIIDTNQFLIRTERRAMVLEPGGVEIFPAMLMAVLHQVPVEQITDLFASHQDPDIISSLGLWDNALPEARLHAPWMWEGFIRHFGCDHIEYLGIPDQGHAIELDGFQFQALPAHFLHSSGNFHLYDASARILMSGDIGMALEPEQEKAPLFVEDLEQHFEYMRPLHQRWMPSNRAKNEWISRARDLDIEILAPQHGRLIKGADVGRFLDWLEELEVGITF